ncbi:MAG: NAD-dependent epimerase/dehydratase family protein [Elusimicrobiaceae bacterium]|nr:NAD-dependent epimerase/dehydratase family protein [Elusimicrobiaceae bacterium]
MLTRKFHWLVTGGAGFIGSHTVDELVRQGQQVTVLDNLSDGKLENLASVSGQISFLNADICDFSALLHACKTVDYIIHLAALTSVPGSIAAPAETSKINVLGTANVLEAAKQCGVKRVIFASSAAVYGTRPELPYKEDTPENCQSPYAWSKQAGSDLCQLYTNVYGLETVVLRYFNVFGPRQNPNSAYAAVIAKFMQVAAQGQALVIEWDGLQSRDFVNVKDVVQANLLAATKGASGEIYNVASGHTYTLLELADTVEKVSGRKLERISRPKRPGDVHNSSANISKITALGYRPTLTLEEGLRILWAEQTKNNEKTTYNNLTI